MEQTAQADASSRQMGWDKRVLVRCLPRGEWDSRNTSLLCLSPSTVIVIGKQMPITGEQQARAGPACPH